MNFAKISKIAVSHDNLGRAGNCFPTGGWILNKGVVWENFAAQRAEPKGGGKITKTFSLFDHLSLHDGSLEI